MGIQKLGGGGGSSAWEEKVWTMLAESCATQADRNNMSYGAGEPFVDATDLTLTNAAVSGGYCANTVTATTVGADLIPTLTSNTSAAGYQAFASSEHATGPAWYTFDKNVSTFWGAAATGMPGYLGIMLPAAQEITAYEVAAPASYPMYAWQFQGSVDGSTWVTLDTRSGYSIGSTITRFSVSVTGYRYFRIYQTSSSDGWARLSEFKIYGVGTPAYPNAATITLNPVTISGATAGRIVFRAQNMDASGAIDVGKTGSNKVEVYPMKSGTAGAALAFTSEDLGSNIFRFTSDEFDLSTATSFGVRIQTFARSVAPNIRLHEALFVWR